MNCRSSKFPLPLLLCGVLQGVILPAVADENAPDVSNASLQAHIQPLLKTYCGNCHNAETTEADLDVTRLSSLDDLSHDVEAWLKIRSVLDSQQMPPPSAAQPSRVEMRRLQQWVRRLLAQEARARAGDPGPVVLRRLSNAEYTATIQDLTQLSALNPAQEFPVDGAAGEGFTNVGSALVMSPQLVRKYLDAAKLVAQHAALVPTGIRFSEFTSQRDLTDDLLRQIREFYARYTTDGSGTAVNLQGIQFETNQGGLLPLADYLTATIADREPLRSGQTTLDDVAAARGLSPVYLQQLWDTLNHKHAASSVLLQPLQRHWQQADVTDVPQLVESIGRWQAALWKFNVVGHVGREGAPAAWMEAVSPITDRQEFRVRLSGDATAATSRLDDVQLRLVTTTPVAAADPASVEGAADGAEPATLPSQKHSVLWQNARLERAGQPSILLRDVYGVNARLQQRRSELLTQLPVYLAAAHDLEHGLSLSEAGQQHNVSEPLLQTLAQYLNIAGGGPVEVQGHFTTMLKGASGYDFINGWGHAATPSVMANASDQEVRIPGRAKPHGLVVHPSVTDFVAVGWRSPLQGQVQVDVTVSDAHDACGNGFEWWIQQRSNGESRIVAHGTVASGAHTTVPPLVLSVSPGELVSLIIGPQAANHVCDLTDIEFVITAQQETPRVWNAAADLTTDILAGNPHADSMGNSDIWHLYQGSLTDLPSETVPAVIIPEDSLLAKWQQQVSDRPALAQQLAALLAESGAAANDSDSANVNSLNSAKPPVTPNQRLVQQLRQLPIPLAAVSLENLEPDPRFGKHPAGGNMAAEDLLLMAPATAEFQIPAALSKYEFIATATVDPAHAGSSICQSHVSISPLTAATQVVDGDTDKAANPLRQATRHAADMLPLICAPDSAARRHLEAELQNFRDLFPAALCYTRIVPVDEVVTATLFHREDTVFQRLMLTADQAAELDQLWDELLYVSEEPLKMVVSLEQIREFATQDRPEAVGPWDRMKPAVQARADAFRQRQLDTQPIQVAAVLHLADRAWRRPLSADEQQALQTLYHQLRAEGIEHAQAVRLLIARVLTSPAFLYRLETPGHGEQASDVSDSELANRLSYFLWSSLPDAELRQLADAGQLTQPAADSSSTTDPLWQQTQRLLQDPKTRRLAIHFACQWLHVREFDQNDDKNENLYPEFAHLRGDMYEETVRFFEDMFRNNGSMLNLLNADHTFVNAALAKHYGIEGLQSNDWQRVNNVAAQGRGGVLSMATVLASQSGASRTSPILRGNWIFETLLGERLPKPPPGVPQLPDTLPPDLTARQLIERHSSDAACARCHERIDPYGFALEQYDALGRLRPQPVDTRTTVFEGPSIDGLNGLRQYLMTQRRTDVMRQFCRKLLGYALGREVLLSDEPLLDQMLQQLEQRDWQFSVAVETIVRSPQFRKIRPLANQQ